MIWGFLKDDNFGVVLKLEISYRVIISWRVLASFRGFFEDYVFAWWNIWVSIILLLPSSHSPQKLRAHLCNWSLQLKNEKTRELKSIFLIEPLTIWIAIICNSLRNLHMLASNTSHMVVNHLTLSCHMKKIFSEPSQNGCKLTNHSPKMQVGTL